MLNAGKQQSAADGDGCKHTILVKRGREAVSYLMPAHVDLGKAAFANLLVDGKLAYIASSRAPGGTILPARHGFLCSVVDDRKRARSVTARGLTRFEGLC